MAGHGEDSALGEHVGAVLNLNRLGHAASSWGRAPGQGASFRSVKAVSSCRTRRNRLGGYFRGRSLVMAVYKLFCFDGAGKLWVDDWIEVATDEEAVAAARAVKDAVKCEVWRQNQLVATIQDGRALYGDPRSII